MVNYVFLTQHTVLMRSLAKHLQQNQFGEQEPDTLFNRRGHLGLILSTAEPCCVLRKAVTPPRRAGSPWHYKIAQLKVLQSYQHIIPGANLPSNTDVVKEYTRIRVQDCERV